LIKLNLPHTARQIQLIEIWSALFSTNTSSQYTKLPISYAFLSIMNNLTLPAGSEWYCWAEFSEFKEFFSEFSEFNSSQRWNFFSVQKLLYLFI